MGRIACGSLNTFQMVLSLVLVTQSLTHGPLIYNRASVIRWNGFVMASFHRLHIFHKVNSFTNFWVFFRWLSNISGGCSLSAPLATGSRPTTGAPCTATCLPGGGAGGPGTLPLLLPLLSCIPCGADVLVGSVPVLGPAACPLDMPVNWLAVPPVWPLLPTMPLAAWIVWLGPLGVPLVDNVLWLGPAVVGLTCPPA